eukprot:COSAG01_NODE_8656_length_2706_cov_11.170694_4_plen_84_part_00
MSPNGWLLSRRGRSSPASASGLDPHRDSISGRFDCRHNFNANVSDYMLTSTYWPAWKAAVQEGKAKGVMCSCEYGCGCGEIMG